MGEQNTATEAFAGALRTAGTALAGVPALLEGARVHETAFGKLFEAAEVRDAYHQRLPETENDVAEALEVIGHFVTGLTGGHPIGERRPGQVPTAPGIAEPAAGGLTPAGVPAQQTGGAES